MNHRHACLPVRGACHAVRHQRAAAAGYNFSLFDSYPTGGFDPGCEGATASAAAPSVFSGGRLRALGGSRR